MFKKITGMADVDSRISDVVSSSKEQEKLLLQIKKELFELKQSNKNVQEDMHTIKSQIKELNSVLGDENEKIKNLSVELHDELQDFKVVKSQLSDKLAKKLSEDLEEIFSPNLERLKTDVKQYNELKSELLVIKSSLSEIKDEISKFNRISKQIKEGDFELSKHARNLQNMDNQKLELMKKIDALERLVGRERRAHR